MKQSVTSAIATTTLCAMAFYGCGLNKTAKGGMIGAGAGGAIGAGIGAMIGKDGKSAAIGAIIGAAVGGTTGALIGRKMDQRAEEIQNDLEGAKIERVGEGILVTFASGILFDVNKSDLTSAAQENIEKLSTVLHKYDDTDVVIVGHTDDTGKEEYNLSLSKQRAQAVAKFVEAHGVSTSRIKVVGEGESTPVNENTTTAGRQANRRVEVAIFANDKMKNAIGS